MEEKVELYLEMECDIRLCEIALDRLAANEKKIAKGEKIEYISMHDAITNWDDDEWLKEYAI